MTDINERLHDWNKTIQEGEEMRNDMRRQAMRMRDGWHRRLLLWLARYMDRWISRGKRWRDEDLSE